MRKTTRITDWPIPTLITFLANVSELFVSVHLFN